MVGDSIFSIEDGYGHSVSNAKSRRFNRSKPVFWSVLDNQSIPFVTRYGTISIGDLAYFETKFRLL